MDDHGNATVVWIQRDGQVFGLVDADQIHARRLSAGSWETETSIWSDLVIIDLQVAMDNDGNAVAVWSEYSGAASGALYLTTDRYSAGNWGNVQYIDSASWQARHPQVAMNDAGDTVVVLEGANPDTGLTHIYADRFSAGAWSQAKLLGSETADADAPHVAMDSLGNTIAVWEQNDGAGESIYYNNFDAGA
jgi:hypothetical protein